MLEIKEKLSAFAAMTSARLCQLCQLCLTSALPTACLLVLLSFSSLPAADFPDRPLDLAIADSPGTALDMGARALAREAGILLGQDIIPRNDPGGGGLSGLARFAAAGPDQRRGYHVAAVVSNTLIFIPQRTQTPYLPLRDLRPVLSFAQAAPMLIGPAPGQAGFWATLDDFLEETRRRPGALRIGVPGLGTPSHIALSMISEADPSLSWRFVPFAGPGEAEAALMGGHVDAAASGALLRVQDGQFTPLMVLASSGLPSLPGTPCLADRGFADPGQGNTMFMILTPSGVPDDVLARLEEAFLAAARSDAFLGAVKGFSVSPLIRDGSESGRALREAWVREQDILRLMGLKETPATRPE